MLFALLDKVPPESILENRNPVPASVPPPEPQLPVEPGSTVIVFDDQPSKEAELEAQKNELDSKLAELRTKPVSKKKASTKSSPT